jgi:hypothetical protein
MRLQRVVAQHRIGADLPEHEVRPLRDDGGVEPRQHVGDFLAAHAAVQHRDFVSGKTLRELLRQPARIGSRRRARARPVGRRGTERDDLDRLAAREASGRVRERKIEAGLAGRHHARGRTRRGCRDRAGRLRPRRKQCEYSRCRDSTDDGCAAQSELAMHD